MFINTKKALAISGIIFCLSAESMDVGSWAKCAHMFKSENDLIKGYVLQNSKLIEGQRFFGPVHLYFNENEMRRDLLLRSFLDSSDDPMTDLIILLFPSAGLGFNAEGTGSFSNVNRTILVAGMLNLANVIRSGEQGVISRITEVDKSNKKEEIERFISEIFPGIKYSQEMTDRYWRLIKDIVFAVGCERAKVAALASSSSSGDNLIYPDFYTNDVILLYAWRVINPEDLVELAARIRLNEFCADLGKVDLDIVAKSLKEARLAEFVRSIGVEELRKVLKSEDQLSDLATMGFDRQELSDFLLTFDKGNRELWKGRHSLEEMDALLFQLAAEGIRVIAEAKETANKSEKNSGFRRQNEVLIADLHNFAKDIIEATTFDVVSRKFSRQLLKFKNFQKSISEFRKFISQIKKIIKKIPGFSYMAKLEHEVEIDKLLKLAEKLKNPAVDIRKIDPNLLLELLKDIISGKYSDITKIIGWKINLNSSPLVQRIIRDQSEFVRYVPFYPGERVLSHTQITTNKGTFTDCAETAIRLLVLTLLSKVNRIEIDEGDPEVIHRVIDKQVPLVIDLSNFSEGSPLRKFFRDGENAIVAANDGHYNTRVRWANLLQSFENLENVYWDSKYSGLSGSWSNIIKMLAALFSGYDGNPEIKDVIEQVNSKRYSDEELRGNFKKFFDIFLKIRTDVALDSDVQMQANNEYIEIKPLEKRNDITTSNTIKFKIHGDHLNCDAIPKFSNTVSQIDIEPITDNVKWIEKLYEFPEKAIEKYTLDAKNQLIMTYYYRFSRTNNFCTVGEAFRIFRELLKDGRFVEIIGSCITFCKDNQLLQMLLIQGNNSPDLRENLKKMCRYVISHGLNIDNIKSALAFLWAYGENLENIPKLGDFFAPFKEFYGNCRWIDFILNRLFAAPEDARLIDKLIVERYEKYRNRLKLNPNDPEIENEFKNEGYNLYKNYEDVWNIEMGLKFQKSPRGTFEMEPISSDIQDILWQVKVSLNIWNNGYIPYVPILPTLRTSEPTPAPAPTPTPTPAPSSVGSKKIVKKALPEKIQPEDEDAVDYDFQDMVDDDQVSVIGEPV